MTASPAPHDDHHGDELEDHDLGLSHDLPTLLNRRRALGLLSATGLAAALAACAGSDSTSTSAFPMPTTSRVASAVIRRTLPTGCPPGGPAPGRRPGARIAGAAVRALGVAASGLLAWGATWWAKGLVGRPRPDTATLERTPHDLLPGNGFPSTHAAIAAATAASLVLLGRSRRPVTAVLVAVAALDTIAFKLRPRRSLSPIPSTSPSRVSPPPGHSWRLRSHSAGSVLRVRVAVASRLRLRGRRSSP